jgi:hypothetical protein
MPARTEPNGVNDVAPSPVSERFGGVKDPNTFSGLLTGIRRDYVHWRRGRLTGVDSILPYFFVWPNSEAAPRDSVPPPRVAQGSPLSRRSLTDFGSVRGFAQNRPQKHRENHRTGHQVSHLNLPL